ncbi:putative transporter small subunit [Brachybacterium sp. GCM10030267]
MAAALTLYVLMWPVIVAGVLFAVVRGFLKDIRAARKEGKTVI